MAIRVTERDIRLLRDLSLSHVLSRDQILALRYFNSRTRVNTRLRGLKTLGLITVIDTPFYGQSLYAVRSKASDVVGERVAPLTASRTGSPRFLQHALSVTNVRIALLERGAESWRFEQQIRVQFRFGGKDYDVRPDGLAVEKGRVVAVEADLGHVAPSKFREKLRGYQAFADSGMSATAWDSPSFTLLVITTGSRRAASLSRLCPAPSGFTYLVRPADRLGITFPGHWS